MTEHDHIRLVLPGPVEVRREILDAQTSWMIGHRQPAFASIFGELQGYLKSAFGTQNRVYVLASSGTGFWEGAVRNCVRSEKRVLNLTCGAFSERWAEVNAANGKQVDIISVEWGQPNTADSVAEALSKQQYDAVCVVHNETSTGVTNPIQEIGEVVRAYPDTLYLVDTVSGFLGAEFYVDDWGIDLALTSSQKAFALPPGLAFAAVSDRVLERASQIEHRGYYFDFLSLEKYITKDNTPSTPPVSLISAALQQMRDIAREGLENRWQRHLHMRDRSIEWAVEHGFDLFAPEGFRSPTVTTVQNTIGVDVGAMASYMLANGFAIDKGYGKLKGKVFRIAHMGDMQMDTLEEILLLMDKFIKA